jgi:MFS family permease
MNTLDSKLGLDRWTGVQWSLVTANLLVTAACFLCYQLKPVSSAMAAFGIGLFVFGPVCGYLLDKYRRKAAAERSLQMLIVALLLYSDSFVFGETELFCLRFFQGAFFGLAQYSLSTLVLDLTPSEQRSEVQYGFCWAERLGLPIGLLLAFVVGLIPQVLSIPDVVAIGPNLFEPLRGMRILVALAMVITAFIIVRRTHVPFRAPLTPKMFSLDRFLHIPSLPVFLNMLSAPLITGMTIAFYLMRYGAPDKIWTGASVSTALLCGFIFALIARKKLFEAADIRSEIVAGYILIGAGLSISLISSGSVRTASAFLSSFGAGLVSCKMLAYFVKMCGHCQRGSAHSSYMLCWEGGICLGYFLVTLFPGHDVGLKITGLLLCLCSILFYIFCMHPWFMHHRNR